MKIQIPFYRIFHHLNKWQQLPDSFVIPHGCKKCSSLTCCLIPCHGVILYHNKVFNPSSKEYFHSGNFFSIDRVQNVEFLSRGFSKNTYHSSVIFHVGSKLTESILSGKACKTKSASCTFGWSAWCEDFAPNSFFCSNANDGNHPQIHECQ